MDGESTSATSAGAFAAKSLHFCSVPIERHDIGDI